MTANCVAVFAAVGLGLVRPAAAQDAIPINKPDDARLLGLESLQLAVKKDGGVPLPPNLDRYVRDRKVAIQLGKALFWDMQVGSDGIQACATCHFHGGADRRAKNQINPDILRIQNTWNGDVEGFFNAQGVPTDGFEFVKPNDTLTAADFPFVRNPRQWVENLDGSIGPAPGNSNDTASSQGVFLTLFTDVVRGSAVDLGVAQTDPVWNVHGVTERRVEPRQTPTVVNAVFNFHNFWDGRANNIFNGQNPFGNQDLNATIFLTSGPDLTLVEEKVRLRNASLASQAVGPPLSFFEMSFGDGGDNFRTWADVGRKLLALRPLALQKVDLNDSVLGGLAGSGTGLKASVKTYRDLIQQAFQPELWGGKKAVKLKKPKQVKLRGDASTVFAGPAEFVALTTSGPLPEDTFDQAEANMAFFFGVSVMLYEATLVADNTPFDQWMEKGRSVPGFGAAELRGLNVFANQGKCINCHGGPELTNASVRNAENGKNLIEPMLMAQGAALYDNGFYNISVTLTTDDIGRGSRDPFGRPLAHSRQVLFKRLGIQDIPFDIIGDPFPVNDAHKLVVAGNDTNGNGFIDPGEEINIKRAAVDGAFKAPGLRNVELTGPYFHNGGMATLRQVVAFYNRGGNFPNFNLPDLDPDIQSLGLSTEQQADLVAFLVSLTDQRVRIQAAPFDHPELFIPNGHPGDDAQIPILSINSVNGIQQAADSLLQLPAVGKGGDAANPLQTFLNLNPLSP
ncbi:cytochrome-c peroxidase [Verrucomicrobiota bacterium sgz303538]